MNDLRPECKFDIAFNFESHYSIGEQIKYSDGQCPCLWFIAIEWPVALCANTFKPTNLMNFA